MLGEHVPVPVPEFVVMFERRKPLRMEGWLEHLLYFAADAAARRDWVQAAKALDAFSACISHGAPLEVRTLCSIPQNTDLELPRAQFQVTNTCTRIQAVCQA